MYKACLESTEEWRGLRSEKKNHFYVGSTRCLSSNIFWNHTMLFTLDLQRMRYMDIEIMLATIHCYNLYHGFVLIMKHMINFNLFFIIQEAIYSTQVYSFQKLSKQH